MKVYVLTTHAVADYDDYGINNRVFANEKDALNALKEWRDDEMYYVEDAGMTVGTDVANHFEAYLEGWYAQYHTEGFVNEYEIE